MGLDYKFEIAFVVIVIFLMFIIRKLEAIRLQLMQANSYLDKLGENTLLIRKGIR